MSKNTRPQNKYPQIFKTSCTGTMRFFTFAFFLSTSAIPHPSWGVEDPMEHSTTLHVTPSTPPQEALPEEEGSPSYETALRYSLLDRKERQDTQKDVLRFDVNHLLDKAKKTAKKHLALDSWTPEELNKLAQIKVYRLSFDSDIDNVFSQAIRKKELSWIEVLLDTSSSVWSTRSPEEQDKLREHLKDLFESFKKKELQKIETAAQNRRVDPFFEQFYRDILVPSPQKSHVISNGLLIVLSYL